MAVSSTGSTFIVGISTGSAPCSSSSLDSVPACSRVLGTRTRFPSSGLSSNHPILSRSLTTCPKTATTGAARPAPFPLSTMSSRHPTTVFWCGSVPHCTRAAGVDGSIPCSISAPTMPGRFSQPMSTAMVPLLPARRFQSTVDSPLVGSSLPLTMVTDDDTLRWVSGMPA